MVGRLLVALETGPHADNTIVVLWADHGYHLGQKEHWEKFALWEQTTRVPLIVSAPGTELQAGATCDQPVSLLDLYPTLAELTATPLVESLDGESLVPLLRTPDSETGRSVVCTQGYRNHAVRTDRWRYIRYEDGSEELYDQLNDAKNFHNLVGDARYASVKREMISRLPKVDAELHPEENYNRR